MSFLLLIGIAARLSIVSNEEPETAVGGTDLSVQLQNVIRNFMRGESAEDGWLRIKTIFSEMNLPNDVRDAPWI